MSMVTGWPGTEVPAPWDSSSLCPGLHHGSIWPPASGPLPLLPSSCTSGSASTSPGRETVTLPGRNFPAVSPPCSLTLPQLATSHGQWLAEVKELGNLLLLFHQPPPAGAVWWGQQVSRVLALSWAGTQGLAGAGMVGGENSGLPLGEELRVVPVSRSAAAGDTGLPGVGLAQAALVARQSLVQDVSGLARFLCSEEMFVHGRLR